MSARAAAGSAPSEIFALTIEAIRRIRPECKIEVLIPDFQGSREALATVLAARPDVLDHNTETVSRLYSVVRPGARFERSLELIARVREMAPEIATKSGLMLGLGEDSSEVLDAMRALVAHGCQILTLGQYLQPHVESGPLVRSSYHARTQLQESENKK
jgi:lipoic acid synthetase